MSARRYVGALIVVSLIVLMPQVAAGVTPTKVYDPPGNQWFPFRNASYLAYQSSSPAHPHRFNAFARDLVAGTNQKLNRSGTEGGPGGFDPGTNVVIFQEWARGSAIRMFDLDSQSRLAVPGALNSRKWEWEPRISTAYISFLRDSRVNGIWYTDLLLYDRVAGTLSRITRMRASLYTQNGSLGERYATWYACGKKTCHAFVYDATTDSKVMIPTRNSRPQYSPTVDETNGNLFFVRSGFKCGAAVTFYSVPVATLTDTPTEIKQLPDGVDADGASLDGPDLIFSRIACGKGTGIYQLANVAT
jgi:hypothetical protein